MYRNAISESLNSGHGMTGSLAYPVDNHVWVVFYYLELSSIALLLAGKLQGPGWVLVYPGVSCLLVAAAYWSSHASVLSKTNGRFRLHALILFAPYLVAVWCSWRFRCSRIGAWTEVAPGILLGRRLRHNEAQKLLSGSRVAVLDLAPEIAETRLLVTDALYIHIPVLDRTAPSLQQLDKAVRFILEKRNRKVFVHCSSRLSRSLIVVAAYLVRRGASSKEAVTQIRGLFPQSTITLEMKKVLQAYEKSVTRYSVPSF